MANIQLADNLRRLRKQYNYTQAQIGKKLHITHQAYSNYETGVREPNLQLLAEHPGSITPLSTRLSLSTAMQRIHHQLK